MAIWVEGLETDATVEALGIDAANVEVTRWSGGGDALRDAAIATESAPAPAHRPAGDLVDAARPDAPRRRRHGGLGSGEYRFRVEPRGPSSSPT
jgi:hypothetical protein